MEFLGHLISKDGRRKKVDVTKLDKIFDLPKNTRKLQRMIGFINWYRDYIPNCSQQISFLTDKLKDGSKIQWKKEDEEKIQQLKQEVCRDVLIGYPDLTRKLLWK